MKEIAIHVRKWIMVCSASCFEWLIIEAFRHLCYTMKWLARTLTERWTLSNRKIPLVRLMGLPKGQKRYRNLYISAKDLTLEKKEITN